MNLFVMIWLRENEQRSAQCFFLSAVGRGSGLERKLKLICVFSSPLGGEDQGEGDYLSSKNANSFDKEANQVKI